MLMLSYVFPNTKLGKPSLIAPNVSNSFKQFPPVKNNLCGKRKSFSQMFCKCTIYAWQFVLISYAAPSSPHFEGKDKDCREMGTKKS